MWLALQVFLVSTVVFYFQCLSEQVSCFLAYSLLNKPAICNWVCLYDEKKYAGQVNGSNRIVIKLNTT